VDTGNGAAATVAGHGLRIGAITGARPDRAAPSPGGAALPQARLQAMVVAARHYGTALDPAQFRGAQDGPPQAEALAGWAQGSGDLLARAVRLSWRQLLRLPPSSPAVLLLDDGGAALLTGVNAAKKVVFLKDPLGPPADQPQPVDGLRLAQVWSGQAVLLRPDRDMEDADAPFGVRWLVGLVLRERQSIRDIALASLTLSFLTIFPPLLVMTVVDKVITHHSYSTLAVLSAVLAVAVVYETLLGYARRSVVAVVGTRIDAKLQLHVFNRLLRLPLEYFERHPAGETMYSISQVYKIRDFISGKLLTAFLDLMALFVLLPFLFWLNASLTWIVVACACMISLIIMVYMRPIAIVFGHVIHAETNKNATLGETIFGVKTVKSLALEPQRKALWDQRIADAGKWRLALSVISNWPQTLVTPLERFMSTGIIMVGAYMALNDTTGYGIGGLFAYMMLSMRVAQPLVGLARLIDDYQDVASSIGQAASVLNRPAEADAAGGGIKPVFSGAVRFDSVTFTYPGTKVPAISRISFSVPAGTMLGLVGRSGSGKSTITRLLQGINREYEGLITLDGCDLREINLRHLRKSFGVVLQENFLFRGSIRDNNLAGRPGQTLEDAVRAAQLAGAEEFIERMPNGYETQIEEGSPNLSGGQRQRLAIARALITDPRILILDEATSALDPESEAVVNANLQRIAFGRTMLIVSHRMSSLTECDLIMVLDGGRVMDIAPHLVLVERCQIYRQLWLQQNRHMDPKGKRYPAIPALVRGG